MKSGSLNLLEPSRAVQACNGVALPFKTFTGLYERTVKIQLKHFLHLPFPSYAPAPMLKVFIIVDLLSYICFNNVSPCHTPTLEFHGLPPDGR